MLLCWNLTDFGCVKGCFFLGLFSLCFIISFATGFLFGVALVSKYPLHLSRKWVSTRYLMRLDSMLMLGSVGFIVLRESLSLDGFCRGKFARRTAGMFRFAAVVIQISS